MPVGGLLDEPNQARFRNNNREEGFITISALPAEGLRREARRQVAAGPVPARDGREGKRPRPRQEARNPQNRHEETGLSLRRRVAPVPDGVHVASVDRRAPCFAC